MAPCRYTRARWVAAFLALGTIAAQPFQVTRVRVEYLASPIGIDEPLPRFSYALLHPQRGRTQSAYRIVVTKSTVGPVTPVWDTGKVVSNQTINIEYAGKPLVSDTDYKLSIIYWDNLGNQSDFSTTSFSTAIFSPSDWNGAEWLAPAPGTNTFVGTFNLDGPISRARLYFASGNYYKAWFNGQLSDDHELGPFTTFQRRVTYDVADVSASLTAGCNTWGIMIGKGWISQPSINAAPPQFMAMLSVTLQNGTQLGFVTSATGSIQTVGDVSANRTLVALPFVSAPGPVTYDDIYDGEVYDSRLVQSGWQYCNFANLSAWTPALPASPSIADIGATLSARSVQIRVDRTYSVMHIDQPAPGVWVLDFGQNMAGTTRLKARCDAGQTIVLHYGEILYPNGTVHNNYEPGAMMLGTYICSGTGDFEEYTTLFSYYGFRYVQLEGYSGVPSEDTLTAYFVHSDNPQTGDFSSSSTLLNAIQHATRYAAMSNQMDVPTDCPQRERRGWLGDAQLSAETNIYNLDMGAFYTKFIRDIYDTQVFDNATLHADGALPDCAPFYGHGHTDSDPGWGIAGFNILAYVADYYGDTRIVERNYPGAKWYLESWITNHVNASLMPFCLWGDWINFQGPECSPDYGSFFYIHALDVMANFATSLNLSADAARYTDLAQASRVAYKAAFFNPTTGRYSNGLIINQLFALTLGIPTPGPEEDLVVQVLVNDILNSSVPGHNTGGIITVKLLYPILQKYGYADLGVAMQLQTTAPSYGYWIQQGATTLWEDWTLTATSGGASYNHIMYGAQGSWYFSNIAGIQRVPGAPSWSNLVIAPPAPGTAPNISYAAASVDSPMGLVASQWQAPSGPAASGGACGFVGENDVLTLSCLNAKGGVGPGTFQSVPFASFGTPTGSCITALQVDPTCNANASVAVVTSACIGKSTCSVTASNDIFGGDPCVDIVKSLAVALTGDCAAVIYSLQTTIPVGATASVVFPVGADLSTATITESGVTVWAAGAFVPGVAGVYSAVASGNGEAVVLQVGSGTYTFASSTQ